MLSKLEFFYFRHALFFPVPLPAAENLHGEKKNTFQEDHPSSHFAGESFSMLRGSCRQWIQQENNVSFQIKKEKDGVAESSGFSGIPAWLYCLCLFLMRFLRWASSKRPSMYSPVACALLRLWAAFFRAGRTSS